MFFTTTQLFLCFLLVHKAYITRACTCRCGCFYNNPGFSYVFLVHTLARLTRACACTHSHINCCVNINIQQKNMNQYMLTSQQLHVYSCHMTFVNLAAMHMQLCIIGRLSSTADSFRPKKVHQAQKHKANHQQDDMINTKHVAEMQWRCFFFIRVTTSSMVSGCHLGSFTNLTMLTFGMVGQT